MADQQAWQPAEQTATGPDGAKMALVGGNWQPAQQTATGPDGKKMALIAPSAGDRAKQALADAKPDLKLQKDGTPTPSPTLKSALESIGTSTAFGGALGAASPEILTAASYAANLIPDVGPEISGALKVAATAAKASRMAAAAGGALSGAVSETAGQGAEALGASKGTADAVRLGAGLTTPLVGKAAQAAHGLYGAVANMLGKATDQPANIAKAIKVLAGTEEAGVPANALHQTLQHGADESIKAAQTAGDKVMADARQRAADVASQDTKAAAKIMDDGQKRADQIVKDAKQRAADLNKASGNRMATAGKVVAQAEPALRVVGQPKELSDIGKELQSAVQQQHQAGLDARQSAYKQLKDQRDSIVQQKEGAGQTLDQVPAMKELKKSIDEKTLGSAEARRSANGLAPVTDKGTLRVYQGIKEAISNRRVMTGVDDAGQPTYQTFKTSFEALDQVRRKLGEVVGGRDVEGYSAIGKSISTKLYDQIGKVQQEFVGDGAGGVNLQKQMQDQYHDASIGLRKFGTGAAGKATALDRVDPERFSADPQGVPKQFFSSQQSVRDLRDLTGDDGLVQRAGSSYVAGQIRGMSAKQVQSYAQKNSDWLREVPGLQKSVGDYATKLAKIESVATKAEGSAKGLADRAGKIVPEAEKGAQQERAETIGRAGQVAEGSLKSQGRVMEEGEKQAKGAVEQAAAPASKLSTILQGGERPEAVRDLLMNGKPEQTRLAARIAAQTPEGKKQLEGSVRQITAQMTPATLNKQWTERLKPMLRDGKMIPPERLKALDSDVQSLLKAYDNKTSLTYVQRSIIAALGSAGSNMIGEDGMSKGDRE